MVGEQKTDNILIKCASIYLYIYMITIIPTESYILSHNKADRKEISNTVWLFTTLKVNNIIRDRETEKQKRGISELMMMLLIIILMWCIEASKVHALFCVLCCVVFIYKSSSTMKSFTGGLLHTLIHLCLVVVLSCSLTFCELLLPLYLVVCSCFLIILLDVMLLVVVFLWWSGWTQMKQEHVPLRQIISQAQK